MSNTCLVLLALVAAFPVSARGQGATGASAVLRRQTQQLLDAVTRGDRAPWARYMDSLATYTDEDGERLTKAALLAQILPLPGGVSGTIELTDWQAAGYGNVVIATHVEDEHEVYHGQKLHDLYRTTDTWLKRRDGWRLIARQVVALQEDPPAVVLPAAVLDGYVGRYAAGPDLVYAIERQGDSLVSRVNGAAPHPLRVEIADVLFTPGQPRVRKLFRRGADGTVTSFVSRREGRDVVFTKMP